MDVAIIGRKNCAAVTVTTAATAISTNGKRLGLVIRNNSSSVTIYLGRSATVTTATGFPLLPGEILQDTSMYNQMGEVDDWYGICSSSADVRVCEFLKE